MAQPITQYVTAMDSYPRASFAPDGGSKIEFPYAKVRWRVGRRHKVHEYIHADGGQIEDQGRKVREIVFECEFYEGFAKDYPGVYPGSLLSLTGYFDQGLSGTLVCPSPIIGSVHAKCVDHSGEIDVKIRSGETVSFAFLQDDEQDFDIAQVVQPSTQSMGSYSADMSAAILAYNAPLSTGTAGLFAQIQAAVNTALSYKDGADLFAMQMESKLLYITSLCQMANSTPEMLDPSYENLFDALQNTNAAALQGINDLLSQRIQPQTYVCPIDMSVGMVAGDPRVYGDASRGQDILQLNPAIPNPFLIPAGTVLTYYPDPSSVHPL